MPFLFFKLPLYLKGLSGLFFCMVLLCSCSRAESSCEPPSYPDLDYSGLPDYCIDNVREQVETLCKVSPTHSADMLYFTDTHYKHNSLDSPRILSFISHHGLTRLIVWGGDAITAYGDIPSEWEKHQRDFLGSVSPTCNYYMVRGNHEFTAKEKETGKGITYTQLQTASLLETQSAPDVVRPSNDSEACYYYFDDTKRKLRYCVFDTTDSIVSPSLPWCTVARTSRKQLEWMDRNALHNVPNGYHLVIVTHIGIAPETYVPHDTFEPLLQLVQNAGAPVLMVISGHRHQDFQTYRHGVLHVLTGSDALYPDLQNSPFLHDVKRSKKTSSAPLMDLFYFAEDRKTIHAMRIGAGYSRTFHLEPLCLSLASTHRLPSTTSLGSGPDVAWTAYDATGYECVDESWDPPSTVMEITSEGLLRPLQTGEAVLMATNECGQKEFFSVLIR